jgi:ubiquinone/menaquinone biosynthesis C-methylase UbiE
MNKRAIVMSDVTPESIMKVALGFMAAKHLFVADEIGMFEKLARGSLTLEALGERMVMPSRTTRIVADAMVALGLLQRQGDRYHNTEVATAFLGGAAGSGLRPFLRLVNRLSYLRWARLEEAVRTDTIIFEAGFNKEEQQLYSEGVEAVTAETANVIAGNYNFGRHQRVLDLGGGTGSFLLAILSRFDKVRGTLYDLPAVTSDTRRRLAQTPHESRIEIVEGDFFNDPIPQGHDAIIIANIIHCFAADRVLELLQRVRNVVSVATRVLLVDFWTNAAHTEPAFSALMAGEFLLTPGGGDVYSIDDAASWFDQTGWRMIEHKALAGPASLIVAEAATP